MKEECKNCIYKGWDCKNCYKKTNITEHNKKFKANLLFTIMLTRQCDHKCSYCALKTENKIINDKVIRSFEYKLKKYKNEIENLRIEFFGGEPLLEFNQLKSIVKKTKKINPIYSIVTNGSKLNKNKIKYLKKNNFEIILTINYQYNNIIENIKGLINKKNKNNFIVNLVIEPKYCNETIDLFKKLIKIGFNKITILPVYYTQKWSKTQLSDLDKILKKINHIYKYFLSTKKEFDLFYIRTNKDSEYNIKKNDIELMLDYNGNIYGDYETELYLLNDIVPNNIFNKKEVLISNITNYDFSLIETILKRKEQNIIKYIDNITKHYGINNNLKKLGKVLNKNNIHK